MNVAVFTGAGSRVPQEYSQTACELAGCIARLGGTLILGGCLHGTLGQMSERALQQGGEVIGVTPSIDACPPHQSSPGLHLDFACDALQRKRRMLELADVCIALPGGTGTLDEMSDLLALHRMGLQQLPLLVLNQNGFYDDLLKFFETMKQRGFVREQDFAWMHVFETYQDIIGYLCSQFPVSGCCSLPCLSSALCPLL